MASEWSTLRSCRLCPHLGAATIRLQAQVEILHEHTERDTRLTNSVACPRYGREYAVVVLVPLFHDAQQEFEGYIGQCHYLRQEKQQRVVFT